MANCCTTEFRRVRLVIAVLTFLVCTFDLATDWYTFVAFYQYRSTRIDNNLMIAIAVSATLGSVLFFAELRTSVVEMRSFGGRRRAGEDEADNRGKSAENWWEVITFCQVTTEDAPVAVIMYFAFHSGGCPLFYRVFQESFVGNLALLGSFSSACWKVLTSLFYCCCGCCIRSGKNCAGDYYCCCCCRAFRSIVAFLVLTFTAYLFFTFNYRGVEIRSDCVNNSTVT
ncbi:hypothetical protein LSH36_228g06016 [Paralvinella palmiformis]|uniref:Uncharacterized protein n=1 Tax=Paralvinella palmiformis TaxID=53620 RepID=A0AAD9JNB7_9ANNE|nr:hypothetical protein LSH36_228g06016 [Paralvinella palmiformis]